MGVMNISKRKIFLISITVVLLTAAFTIYINYDPSRYQTRLELEKAVRQSGHIYNLRKSQGMDFSKGPCLVNILIPGWALDSAHSPRISEDDLPQNQCSSYLDGSAKHFVELDLNGNLIRAK